MGEPAVTGEVDTKPELPELPKLDIDRLAQQFTCLVFNSIYMITGHEHWLKDHSEVREFTDPLCVYLRDAAPKLVKKVERSLPQASAIAGLANIAGPDIVMEFKIRSAKRAVIRGNQGTQGQAGSSSVNTKAAGNPGMARNGVPREPIDDASATIPNIPSISAIDDRFDV